MADLWYYTRHGKRHGPVQAPQLKQLAIEEKLHPFDYVWKEGHPHWVPATSVKGLFSPEQLHNPEPKPKAIRVEPITADYEKAQRQRDDQENNRRGMPTPDRSDRARDRYDDLDDSDRDRDRERGRERDRDGDRDRHRDDDRGERRLPRGRKRRKGGMSKGLLIGLIAGGGGLVVVIVLIVVLMFAFGGHGKKGNTTLTTTNIKPANVTLNLPKDTRIRFEIEADERVPLGVMIYQGTYRLPTVDDNPLGPGKSRHDIMQNTTNRLEVNFFSLTGRIRFRPSGRTQVIYRTQKAGTHRLYVKCWSQKSTKVRVKWEPVND